MTKKRIINNRLLDNDSLERLIKKRLALIKKIVNFVLQLLRDHGQTLKNEDNGDHIHVVREICNFGGFHFVSSNGETSMGGNHVYIHSIVKGVPDTVFEVYWQAALSECILEKFDESGSWVKYIEDVMKRKNELIQQMEESMRLAQKQHKEVQAVARERQALEETAKRLKLM